jgi:site-specific DNA-methyltransferase (adenine-specific)
MTNASINTLFSSRETVWVTPQWLFDKYNAIFNFNTDVCALADNAKCKDFYTPETNGLLQDWHGVVWMNPPYGRNDSYLWVKKAHTEMKRGVVVVALLPARTDTRWFHDFIYQKPGVTVEFLKGRLKFGGAVSSAPFPSMIVTFKQ